LTAWYCCAGCARGAQRCRTTRIAITTNGYGARLRGMGTRWFAALGVAAALARKRQQRQHRRQQHGRQNLRWRYQHQVAAYWLYASRRQQLLRSETRTILPLSACIFAGLHSLPRMCCTLPAYSAAATAPCPTTVLLFTPALPHSILYPPSLNSSAGVPSSLLLRWRLS